MNKHVTLGIILGALLLGTIAAVIDSRSMNTNQFNVSGNQLSIKSGVALTNPVIASLLTGSSAAFSSTVSSFGFKPQNASSSRIAIIDPGGTITNIAGTPTGKLFARDDDTLANPLVGDASSLTNLGVVNNTAFMPASAGLTNYSNGTDGITNFVGNQTNLTTQLVATNSTVNSNLTFTVGKKYTVYPTNSVSATNWVFASGMASVTRVIFRPQLVNRTFIYPTNGTAAFGMYWPSNLDGTISAWGTLTQGVAYVWVIEQDDTNFFSRMTAWQ